MPAGQPFKDQISIKIVLIYILIGCAWILLSDLTLEWIDGGSGRLTVLQTYKGWFYVVATGLLLYLLIQRAVSDIKDNELKKQEAGARYSELVENASDIVYSTDTDGKFTSINRAGETVTGYARAELLEKNLADIVAPESRKYVNRILGKAAKGESSFYELEINKKDGGSVLLEISNSPIYLDGNLIETQGIARDLTARRAVEIKLRESEARNRELIETTNEGVWITDEEGIVTFVNKRMSEMLDYDPAEIIDNYAFDFIDSEDQEIARKKLEERKTGIKETFDFKFKTFDGKDLWAIVSSKPLFENDKYIGSIAMVTDITERKLAEDSLRNEQKINNATIASLPAVFYFYDEEGHFLRWNRNLEIVSGYVGEEVARLHPLELIDPEQREMIEKKMEEVFEKGEVSVQANFYSKNGTKTPYFFTGKKLILDDKAYLVGVGIDVSNNRTAIKVWN